MVDNPESTNGRETPAKQQTRVQQPTQAPKDEPYPINLYTFSTLVLQALLAAPDGQWLRARDILEHLAVKYPLFREQEAMKRLNQGLYDMTRAAHLLEKKGVEMSGEPDLGTPFQWRVLAGGRETATHKAWRTKRSYPPPETTHSESGSLAINTCPYRPKQLALQALLAAPEGQWMQVTELVDDLYRQYAQALALDRTQLRVFGASINAVLNRTPDLVEKFEFDKPRHVCYRLVPDIRDEATRLAWPEKREQSTTHNVPE